MLKLLKLICISHDEGRTYPNNDPSLCFDHIATVVKLTLLAR